MRDLREVNRFICDGCECESIVNNSHRSKRLKNGDIPKKRFCSGACYQAYRKRETPRKKYVCDLCGGEKLADVRPKHKNVRCMACRTELSALIKKHSLTIENQEVIKRKLIRTVISQEKKFLRGLSRKANRRRPYFELTLQACFECGEPLPDGRRRWCSDRCNGLKRERFNPIPFKRVLDKTAGKCYYCNVVLTYPYKHGDKRSATEDHIVPLSRGGSKGWFDPPAPQQLLVFG